MIEEAFSRLDSYCRGINYQGWDVFDGLNSRLFASSFLAKSSLLRLGWIQFFKRSPINFRRIALVPHGYNAKGLGLFVSGLLALGRIDEAQKLLEKLMPLRCQGYAGTSWGYNFPWQARAFYVPVGKPNMVTTVFVANAFCDYYDNTGDSKALQIAADCCVFMVQHLIISENTDSICFGYIPDETAKVHNVNMLGAALLARVAAINGDTVLVEKSRKAMYYSIKALQQDFSWPYGELHHHQWIDNFHTGFNLVALHDWSKYTGDNTWKEELKKAYAYFLHTFWQENGCPKYYNNSLYPVDIHCSAQGIITYAKLEETASCGSAMAEKIACWAIENMQDKQGYFYYQQTKWFTNKIPYIRWSQAWMFYALATLLAKKRRGEQP